MTTTDISDSTLTGKLKSRLALVQSSIETAEVRARQGWGEVPARLRQALSDIAQRLRAGLDIPSGAEVAALADRLEDLDRKLQLLEDRRSSDAKTLSRLEQNASRGDGKSPPTKRTRARNQDGSKRRSTKGGDHAGKKAGKNNGAAAKNAAGAKNGASAKNGAGAKNGASSKNSASAKNNAGAKNGASAKNGAATTSQD